MFRVVHFTVKRSEATRRRAPLAIVALAGVVVAGTVMAAPGFGFDALPGIARDGYAVRFVLPATKDWAAISATPTARTAPLTQIATDEAASDDSLPTTGEPVVTATEIAPVALAAVSTLPVPTVARAARLGKVSGIIALSYSLAGGSDAKDAIEIDKPISIAGVDAGRVPIRIDGNAKVYAQGKRLAALIAASSGEKAVPAGLGEGYVSLEALRALGIGVRYDAIGDRLVVDPPAA